MRKTWMMLGALLLASGTTLGACGGPPPAEEPDPPPLDEGNGGNDGEQAGATSPKVKEAAEAIEAGDLAKAKPLLEEALKENADDAQANYYMGVVLEGEEQFDGAAEHYGKALKADPKLLEAAVNLSAILLDIQKDAKGALGVVDGALEHEPKHPGLLMNRALALEAMGDAEGALSAYGAASAASPDNQELRYAYAELLAGAGKTDEALATLDKIQTEDVKVLAAVAVLFGKLKAFPKCVATLDKALKASELPQLYVRRAACRNGAGDKDGATADYKTVTEKEPDKAAGFYYLGKHLKELKKVAEARKALQKAVELDKDGKVGKAAAELLKKP